MALQTSGPISLNDMHVEVGGSSNSLCSVNDADIRDLISRGANTSQNFQEYYGKSAETSLPSGGNVNGQAQLKRINASDYICHFAGIAEPKQYLKKTSKVIDLTILPKKYPCLRSAIPPPA